jgi:tetratricopeptide (TPR) repeat protein
MSEHTQPTQPLNENETQPMKPVKIGPRWGSIFISILGFILLLALGGFGGFRSGIGVRENAEAAIRSQQASEQYTLALVDIQFGRYETARQRLEFVIDTEPSFTGAKEKLTEVLVLSVIPTPTPLPTVTSTPDFSGAESAYGRAQQLILAQDWPGSLSALDTIRKLDPTYKTAQVDGMYYFALRNYGHALITQQGNLEGGIYYLTLAERFGPLDNTAVGLREGARAYITGASFWELDWKQAVAYFSQVGAGWPSMWDGTMTASDRLRTASMRFGDELFAAQDFCGAYEQYKVAAGIGNLDDVATRNSNQAFKTCFPATPTIAIATTAPAAATTDVVATDPPTVAPTDTPTETPIP